ncbi:hypothetical protein NQ315_011120 [Exocentrus adspersus]|uniref:UDP-glycosyltransferase n=1 Tax=Exocentrus adspersus TaxID=1586481 RepID=A0AAV8VX45_9CUCU|nr:hypothetical protein NQ315_011120 [Exocentrus adspersus]
MVKLEVFFISLVICFVEPAKILGIFHIPATSHFTLGFRLMKELADRGHEVTMVSPFPRKEPIANYTDVPVESMDEALDEFRKDFFKRHQMCFTRQIKFLHKMAYSLTEKLLSHKTFQELLKSEAKFDLVIVEYFLAEALLGVGKVFNAPVVLFSSLPSFTSTNYIFANPAPSSYVPHLLTQYTGDMDLGERFVNLAYNLFDTLCKQYFMFPAHDKLLKKYISQDLNIEDVMYNASLILLNSHPSVSESVPHVSNMIEIGGFHVTPPKGLSTELQAFMDNATEGVVIFSMGSNLRSTDLDEEKRAAILNSFRKIKQKVLWKFEDEDLPGLPSNVKLMKWLPQTDLLAHPNTRAFISHGGMLSIIETVHFGVPVIGIPVFGDQKMNIAKAQKNGYAVSVPFQELSEEKLSWALEEVLNNPNPGYSQFILAEKLMTELARRGHEMTVISPYKPKTDVKNYRTILVDDLIVDATGDLFEQDNENVFKQIIFLDNGYRKVISEHILAHKGVQKLIHSNDTFDLVIVELAINEVHMAFAPYFNAPLVTFDSFGISEWSSHFVGNIRLPSVNPLSLSPYTDRMTFFQRLHNAFLNWFEVIFNELVCYPGQQELLNKYFPKQMRLQDIMYNISIMLLNSHASTTYPATLTTSVIEIGGFHVSEPKKLPSDIKKYLDEATEGAIFFAMGSILKSADLPKEKLNGILRAFSNLKQKVLWKFEDSDILNKPKNLFVSKWMPQNDILAHPNVVAFITHGGMLSTTEAIHHGVPMVGIPIFADQKMNVALSVKKGLAVHLPLKELSEGTLIAAITEVIRNPVYSRNAKKFSAILKDQPIKPLDSAIFWTEYVIRHGGAPHLRNAAVDLYWFQLYLVDVVLFIFFCLAVFYYCVKLLVRRIISIIRNSTGSSNKQKVN